MKFQNKFSAFAFCLFVFLSSPDYILSAQPLAGTTGLLNTPSAEMQSDGIFLSGANYLPDILTRNDVFNYNTLNYYVSVTFLPFIEASYRMILLRDADKDIQNQDRSVALKARIFKEKKFLPSLAIGGNDIYTTVTGGGQYFWTLYIAASKHFKLGKNLLIASAGYAPPYFQNKDLNGVFGGISFSPSFLPEVNIIAEYDSRAYNAGGSILLFKHLFLFGMAYDLKQFAGGIAIRLNLKNDRKSN